MSDKIEVFHRSPTGRVVAHSLSRIDANHAVQFFPDQWSLTMNGFAAPGDHASDVAAKRRLLMSPGFEGDVARAAERGS